MVSASPTQTHLTTSHTPPPVKASFRSQPQAHGKLYSRQSLPGLQRGSGTRLLGCSRCVRLCASSRSKVQTAEDEASSVKQSFPQEEGEDQPSFIGRSDAAASGSHAPAKHRSQPGSTNGTRSAAQAASVEDVAARAAQGRDHWLWFVHPEVPQAGEQAVIYFNRSASDILRYHARVQMHVKFNGWELEGPNGSWIDLSPSSAAGGPADWWAAKVDVPEEAFEMNYIFSDGEGTSDNNSGQDYLTVIQGRMTRDAWLDAAPERAAAAEAVRKEEERRAAEATERERRQVLDQQDRENAKARAERLRERISQYQQGAFSEMSYRDGPITRPAWRTEPAVLRQGQKAKLLYNAKVGPLYWLEMGDGTGPVLHIGHNGWQNPQELQMTRAKPLNKASKSKATEPASEEDWWEAEVEVAPDAVVLNWVVQYYEHFDNNNGADHKTLVEFTGTSESREAWFEEQEEQYYREAREQRRAAEEAERAKQEKRAVLRRAAEAKVAAVRRRQMRHMLFTEPDDLRAGQTIELCYNPHDTPLHGSQQIFVRGGWNRWSHPRPFGPIKMIPPADGGSHFRASIAIPANAYKMDFVFSNVEQGDGIYDNRGGLDYHLPVEGSKSSELPLYVAHVAVEMAPICKVGGLGDVVTALGRAVKEQGHNVEVILPRYDFFLQSPLLGATTYEAEFAFGGTYIYVSKCVVEGLQCFFIEPQNGFFSDTVYGRKDDEVRFDFFCKAALEFLLQTGRQPDILHCHDWSTACIARAYWRDYHNYGLWKPKVVFTIHNADFKMTKLGEAAHHCQRFTTVSPTYAYEIGGLPAFAPQGAKFMGIRNGIDADIWDPQNDPFLPMAFNADNVTEGKAAAREALRGRLGLTGWGDKPVIGVVTRLTAQKGIHLIKHAAWRTLERGGQFVLLGSAPDPRVQAEFNSLAAQLGGENAAFCFTYDEPLSHLIYAGCDMILVPSMFEPCGLTQLIAMRYGSVPVVRSTGGLRDTVFDVDYDKARAAWEMEGSSDWQRDGIDETNGFAFEGTDGPALEFALNRALDAWYNNRAWFHSLQKRVMLQDWSWNKPALDYIELYFAALKS
ncbi:hypothetical protein WJX72_007789 [[Myrmecia] bisecta]|uniref:starch synthase n=1 Tax=[Myrmecia] bisecta TaxID=41462 RepID=A0AAW1P7M6_9CHLO